MPSAAKILEQRYIKRNYDSKRNYNKCKKRNGGSSAKIETRSRFIKNRPRKPANPQMIEQVRVDYYGVPTPLKQMAVINVSDARTLEIQPWDAGAVKDIEKALSQADLGAAPTTTGKVIRIIFPPMTEDRRKTLSKTVAKMSEDYKVAVRNERRDVLEKLKKAQKSGEVTEDDLKRYEADIQKSTDEAIALIVKVVEEKEKEIMTI